MKSFTSTAVALMVAASSAMAQTPSGFSPSTHQTLSVKFGNNKVVPGHHIPLEATALSPAIDFSGVSGDSAHVVLMLDLDAPMGDANRTYAPLLHWMTSIPAGLNALSANESNVKPVAPYFEPQPPAGYGLHRYVVLVLETDEKEFELPPGFENETYADVTSRVGFPLQKFIHAGGYSLAAANWFTTENDTATAAPTPTTTPVSGASKLGLGGFGLLGLLVLLI